MFNMNDVILTTKHAHPYTVLHNSNSKAFLVFLSRIAIIVPQTKDLEVFFGWEVLQWVRKLNPFCPCLSSAQVITASTYRLPK